MVALRRFLAVLAVSMVFLGNAVAADFPTKPIQLVLGFKAGGALDTMARIAAEAMSNELGQPVMVQNKEGGGGNLASTFVKNEKADGYTISMIPSNSMVYNPMAMKTKYTADDFAYIGAGVLMEEAFVCLPDKPYKTFEEMIVWAKQNNQKLRYASVVPLDIAITKAIAKDTGVEILPVPTQGGAASMTNVLGGHVDFGFSGGIHYQYVKADRMIILMGLGSKRLAAFPDVPTIVESGWDLPMDNYYMMFVRKETPQEVQDLLAAAAKKAFTSEKFMEVVEKTSLTAEYIDPAQSTEKIAQAKEVMKKFQ